MTFTHLDVILWASKNMPKMSNTKTITLIWHVHISQRVPQMINTTIILPSSSPLLKIAVCHMRCVHTILSNVMLIHICLTIFTPKILSYRFRIMKTASMTLTSPTESTFRKDQYTAKWMISSDWITNLTRLSGRRLQFRARVALCVLIGL